MFILVLICSLLFLVRKKFRFLLLAVILVIGFVYWSFVHPQPPNLKETYLNKVQVLVLDIPEVREGELRFIGLVKEEEIKVRVFLPGFWELEKGDLLEVSGSLRTIRGATNPGDFDYREYWAHRGVFYNLLVKDKSSLRVLTNQSSVGQEFLIRVIKRGRLAIESSMSGEEKVLLEGMLFGFQGEISEEQYFLFQKSGLVHIFSVSGFHVGFIVLMGVWTANRLGKRKTTRFLIVLSFITLYGFMTGWPSPMVRASIMASLGLMAHYLGREEDLPTSLALAGIVLLVINPANLFEISFQLSFLATWGLIYLYPRWRDLTEAKGTWKAAVLLSLAPQIATLPLAAYYFNLVSLISVVANLVLVNVAGGAVIIGFLGVVAAQFSQFAASLFMVPAGFLTALVKGGAAMLGGIPGSFLWVAQPDVWLVVAAYFAMVLLWAKSTTEDKESMELKSGAMRLNLALGSKISKWLGFSLMLVFLASLLMPGQFKDPGVLRVVFLDVGQGDAMFIKTPHGFTILVDGGGSEFLDVGKRVVLPFLRRQGIRSLDLAIATHPHIDHLQGLKAVIKECPARMVVAGRGCFTDSQQAGGNLLVLQGQREFFADRSTSIWLWAPDSSYSGEIGNETSVITRIVMGEVSFLLTGDAGVPEIELLMIQPGLDLSATVLKLPHHGSKHSWSEDFANRVNPQYGVVCVGLRNPFGHPDAGILEQTEQKGVRIFRTDQDGAVTFLTRGRDVKILTGP